LLFGAKTAIPLAIDNILEEIEHIARFKKWSTPKTIVDFMPVKTI